MEATWQYTCPLDCCFLGVEGRYTHGIHVRYLNCKATIYVHVLICMQ